VAAADYERFSDGAHRAVVQAERVARDRGHDVAGPEDLLIALAESDPAARRDLEGAGATPAAIRSRVEEWAPPGSSSQRVTMAMFSPLLQRAVQRASRFAAQERGAEVTGRHLLRGLLDGEDEIVWRVLISLGVDPGPLARPAATAVRSARNATAAATAAVAGAAASGARQPLLAGTATSAAAVAVTGSWRRFWRS
jgi:ATP-dependent Clp protease ATP-binding subunit ClpC